MPKGKSVRNPGDWRPVSVLPLPSKNLKGLYITNLFITLSVIVIFVRISMVFERSIVLLMQFLNIHNFYMITLTN